MRILAGLGIHHIDPRALVEDLSLAQRQIVEIVRVIIQDPDILLLDEPTSSLGENEVDWLFGLIRDLRARGKCIIFTSHRWNEITDIADRITIFRNGARARHLHGNRRERGGDADDRPAGRGLLSAAAGAGRTAGRCSRRRA